MKCKNRGRKCVSRSRKNDARSWCLAEGLLGEFFIGAETRRRGRLRRVDV